MYVFPTFALVYASDCLPNRSYIFVSFQLKMVLIKCCDISNEVRPTEVAEPWVDCLLEEYFMQVPKKTTMRLFVYKYNVIYYSLTTFWFVVAE